MAFPAFYGNSASCFLKFFRKHKPRSMPFRWIQYYRPSELANSAKSCQIYQAWIKESQGVSSLLVSTHLKNIISSNWNHFPEEGLGWTFQKYLSCHHLVITWPTQTMHYYVWNPLQKTIDVHWLIPPWNVSCEEKKEGIPKNPWTLPLVGFNSSKQSSGMPKPPVFEIPWFLGMICFEIRAT